MRWAVCAWFDCVLRLCAFSSASERQRGVGFLAALILSIVLVALPSSNALAGNDETIEVCKITKGGTGTFDFEIDRKGSPGDPVFSITTKKEDERTCANKRDLRAGEDYDVLETDVPSGWELESIVCSSNQRSSFSYSGTKVSISRIKRDEKIKCTFTNTKKQKGRITIIKKTEGGFGKFRFDGDGVSDFNIETSQGSNPRSYVIDGLDLNKTYKVTEKSADGWTLTDLKCTAGGSKDGNATAKIVLSHTNKDVTCTFTNTKKQKGRITIIKKTEGGFGKFRFDGDGVADFNIETSQGSNPRSYVIDDLDLNKTYKVTEKSADGWMLTDLKCTAGGSKDGNATAKIVLSHTNKDVTCTFTNTKKQKGKITIIKKSEGGFAKFRFNGEGVPGFDIETSQGSNPQSHVIDNLDLDQIYKVTEIVESGWTLTGLNCTAGGGKEGNATAKIALSLTNKDVTCTYTNTRDTAELTIKKVTIGGNGSFSFTVSGQGAFALTGGQSYTLAKLPTGDYTIAEGSLPDGWTLQSISNCGQVDLANRTVTVTLTISGATCTFTNFKEKDDPAEDETERFIQRRVDNLLTYGPDRARMLRRLQDQPPSQQSLKDGPIKFSSGGVAGGAGPMMVGRSPMGLASPPGMSLGMSPSAMGSGTAGLPYAGPFKYDGVTYFDGEEEGFTHPYERSATSSLLGQVAAQLTPLTSGEGTFKFGTSLSELRATAVEAEAAKQREKLAQAGLGFADQPFADRNAAMRQGVDIWVEGHVAKYNDDIGGIGRDGNFRILYAGVDYPIAPGVLIGALVQIDDTEEDIDDPTLKGKIEGTGWMAGPYVGVRLRDNLFFDARAAWGRSDNDIALDDPLAGPRRGSFDTDRWLTSASLTGNEYVGPWRFSPQLQVAYGHEEADAYTTSLGQKVSNTEATIGRLTGTMEVGYRVERSDGTVIEPHVAISGIWNFDTDDLTFNGVLYETDETRAKVEGGVLIHTPDGWGLRAAGAYDGIGGGDYDAYSGSLWVNIPLN